MTIPFSSVSGRLNGTVSISMKTTGATPAEIRKQLPWALTFGMNRSGEETNLATQQAAIRNLIIRKPDFVRNVFKLRYRASVKTFQATGMGEVRFGIRADDFRGRASVFVDHEDGNVRQATGTRAGFLYVPTYGTTLRPTIRDLYPSSWYPKALGLADKRAIEGGLTAGGDRTKKRRGSVRGKRATVKAFTIRSPINSKPVGIFRRLGAPRMVNGRDMNLEMLFKTYQRRAIRPKLKFRSTALRIGLARLEVNIPGMLDWALNRAAAKSAKMGERATLASLPIGARLTARGIQ